MPQENNSTDASLHAGATSFQPRGAMLMVPPEDVSAGPPLCDAELELVCEQNSNGGIDYAKAMDFLNQALANSKATAEFKVWDQRPLSDFENKADIAVFDFLLRLLVLWERARREDVPMAAFHAWLKGQGYKKTPRTLRRQIWHATLALLLAGHGLAHRVPSQTLSDVVCAKLPREAWVDFFKTLPPEVCGKQAVKRALQSFAETNQCPLRGQPVVQPQASPALGNLDTRILPHSTGVTTGPEKGRKLTRKRKIESLASKLPDFLPAYHLKEPLSVSSALVDRLQAATLVSRPGRHAKLKGLMAALKEIDPHLWEKLHEAAIVHLVGEAVDKAIAEAKGS